MKYGSVTSFKVRFSWTDFVLHRKYMDCFSCIGLFGNSTIKFHLSHTNVHTSSIVSKNDFRDLNFVSVRTWPSSNPISALNATKLVLILLSYSLG